jgi:hypothetical protein
MGQNAERAFSRPDGEETSHLFSALNHYYPNFPYNPDPASTRPREILVRVEAPIAQRLSNPSECFNAQTGAFASRGIFLGDCLQPLPQAQKAMVFVFNRDLIAARWLCYPSQEWQQCFNRICHSQKLNPQKIGDGLTAEEQIYQTEYVYQKKTGICTAPQKLEVKSAQAILVPKTYLSQFSNCSISPELAGKLIPY